MDNEFYASGEIPMAGDLIEFGSQGGRMLVSRVLDLDSSQTMRLVVGAYEYSPHLAVLIARHGQQDY